MATAQGINKITSYKKQTGLAAPASGSGGQKYRRRTAVWTKPKDTFENDEIVSHQMSTGVSFGGTKPMGKVDGLLSPGAYSDWFASLLRRNFAAVTAISGLSITIATAGQFWAVTRSTGSWLTDGVKVGQVGRLSAGSFNAANLLKNMLVVSMTATVLTVRPLNGVAMAVEGSAVTGSTFTVIGKTTFTPTSGHTSDYYTFEQFFPDLVRSETFTDAMIAKADLNVSASGNTGVTFDIPALNRVLGASQVLTSPAAEVGNDVVTGAFGAVIVNGAVVANVTSFTLSIDGTTTHSDLVLGATASDDMQRGRIKVTGSFTAKFDSVTLQTIADAGSVTSIVLGLAEDLTGTADFITFTLPAIKLTGDDLDDGEKQLVRSYPFTAQYNAAGGAGTSSEQTILAMQDSAAA